MKLVAFDGYIDIEPEGNTYAGEWANRIMHLVNSWFRELGISPNYNLWIQFAEKIIIPRTGRRAGLVVFK